MTTGKWKFLFNIIVVIGILALGFYFGRKTVKMPETKIETEYIKGDTIRDTLYYPKPYKITEPIDTLSVIQQCIKDGIYKELWPEKVITEYIEVTKEDTTKIIQDWATKRYYSETLFNDDIKGKCSFNAELQYNRMRIIDYEFMPITKTITETKYVVKTFKPFVGISLLSNPWAEIKNPSFQVNGGVVLKDKFGLQALYQRGMGIGDDYIGGGIIFSF
jgi:hypothetical protein